MPVCRDCGRSFGFPEFKNFRVCKGFTYSNRYFGAMIPQVAVELIKSGTIVMDNISKVDVLNAVPSRVVMELFSILHLFNRGWVCRQNQGRLYGDNFITHFKDNIAEMFERIEHYKS